MTIGRIIDVSSDQHPDDAPINWAEVRAAGVEAVFIKCTEGLSYVNPWYARDLAGALEAGLQAIAYHYAGMLDPTNEARFFRFHAGARARVLDYETNTNVAWARTFLAELELPPNECMTYGSLSSLVQFYVQIPSMIWVAAYGQGSPGFGVCWQFTDEAEISGITGPVDEDKWQGDESQFDALFGITVEGEESMFLAPTPTGKGYWKINAQGQLITYGDAAYLGSVNTSNTAPASQPPKWDGPPVLVPGRTVIGIVAHPLEQGYWIEDNIGDYYAYGAAPYFAAPN